MSDERTITPPAGPPLRAGEYALGVLDADERRQAQQRMARDEAFANEVAFWEERLGVLADDVAPVAPPAKTWKQIERALPGGETPAARETLWQSLVFWRSFAIGSALLTAASIGALTFIEISPIEISPLPRPQLVATLGGDNGQPAFVAAVNADGASLTVMPASPAAAEERAYELWLIPEGDHPHSLGLLEPGRPGRVDVPRELMARLSTEATLAVSLEPPGGSPTGQPTGPVIASGKLASL
jgi:anti-sigma-K factor RskA